MSLIVRHGEMFAWNESGIWADRESFETAVMHY